jgi:hypothetical protein
LTQKNEIFAKSLCQWLDTKLHMPVSQLTTAFGNLGLQNSEEEEEQYEEIMAWTRRPNTEHSLIEKNATEKQRAASKTKEREWGNKMRNGAKSTCQWTTKLGENIVKTFIQKRGFNVKKIVKAVYGLMPDLEFEHAIVEVKSRNWTTSGTAGEKVLGVPMKYSRVPEVFGKPLWIVCVAYQEHELTHKKHMQVFGDSLDSNRKATLDLWKSQQIEFVKFTELGEKLETFVSYPVS